MAGVRRHVGGRAPPRHAAIDRERAVVDHRHRQVDPRQLVGRADAGVIRKDVHQGDGDADEQAVLRQPAAEPGQARRSGGRRRGHAIL
jgi:hypothetical protein